MLTDHLLKNAATNPQATAIIDDNGQFSYLNVASAAMGVAKILRQKTDKPRVGLLLPPSAGFVVGFYGALLAGKTIVPINYLLGEKEIAHVIADSGIDLLITAPPLMGKFANSGLNIFDLSAMKPGDVPATPLPPPPTDPEALAVLMYTSGTSGLPKGVMLSQGNLQSDVDACIEYVFPQKDHKFLGIIPLFHAFGMTAMMLAPIQLAVPVIYIARFSAPATLEAIRKHKPTILFGVPAMFGAILRMQSAKADDFAGFYALMCGGEPLSIAVREGNKQRFGVNLLEGYGLTETSPVACVNTPPYNRAGSVGRSVPRCEIRITGENGEALGKNTQGEIWIKGPMVMKGYFNLPEQTAKVLTPDGYFRTGDLGHLDDEGYLYITGRVKDLIISSGEKIAPREIEEVLCQHPGVAEVAVVGAKDPLRGEAVAAFVVPREGQSLDEKALAIFCREKGLPNFKVPRDFHIVADLPRSPTGKILKRQLVEKLG